MRMPCVSMARGRVATVVQEIVNLKCGATGNIKSAIRDISRETGISSAWLRRAWRGTESFAPLMHYYDCLCSLLEAEIERQERRCEVRKRILEGMRRNAVGEAVVATDVQDRTVAQA